MDAIASITCTNSTLIYLLVLALEDSDKKTTGQQGFSRDKDSAILDTRLSFVTMKTTVFTLFCPSPNRTSIHYRLLDERGIGKENAGGYQCEVMNGLNRYEKRIWLLVGMLCILVMQCLIMMIIIIFRSLQKLQINCSIPAMQSRHLCIHKVI